MAEHGFGKRKEVESTVEKRCSIEGNKKEESKVRNEYVWRHVNDFIYEMQNIARCAKNRVQHSNLNKIGYP